MKNKTPDRRLNNVQNISISDNKKKATNYKIKQTQQVTVPSSEEIIASCNNIVLCQFPEANSTDIFIVYIFTYVIILSCLYAVRQGNVLFKENGKEENALQLSIPTHNLFESLYLFCPNCDIFHAYVN